MKKETFREWDDMARVRFSPYHFDRFNDTYKSTTYLYDPEIVKIKYIMSINDNIEEHNNLMRELIEVLKNNKDVYE